MLFKKSSSNGKWYVSDEGLNQIETSAISDPAMDSNWKDQTVSLCVYGCDAHCRKEIHLSNGKAEIVHGDEVYERNRSIEDHCLPVRDKKVNDYILSVNGSEREWDESFDRKADKWNEVLSLTNQMLTDRQQEVFQCVYVDHMTAQATSEQLGISLKRVEQLVSAIKKNLKKEMNPNGDKTL